MIEDLYKKYLTHNKISTDTRNIEDGGIFFALKGANFNGNVFASQAISKGASFAVIDEEKYKEDDQFIVVDNTLHTLQELAKHHRNKLRIPIIGITGSNGKTTTKELIYNVLQKKYKVFATKGNLNNHIGVPLTLLSMDNTIEIGIVEMGANKVGDIAELCAIANPNYGLITNIGRAHIGTFGGVEGILRGKTELYQHILANDGVIFMNSKDDILKNMSKRMKKVFFYPDKNDYLHCEFIEASPFVHYKVNNTKIKTHLIGQYNFNNIAAALCIGKYFEVPITKANEAIENYIPSNNRSQIVKKDTNTIILDAYNANPDSMKAALENLKSMNVEKKAVILGDMYELGTSTQTEHEKIGELTQKGIDYIFLCGENMKAANKVNPKAQHFNNTEDLNSYLQQHPLQNTTILVKGSRAMGLEHTISFL